IVALSNVRRRHDALMEHAAAAPGSTVGQQVYSTRIQAKLSAREVENGAGVREGLLDDLEAGANPPRPGDADATRGIAAPGGAACLAPNISSTISQSLRSPRRHTSTAGTKSSSAKTPAKRNQVPSHPAAPAPVRQAAGPRRMAPEPMRRAARG